MEMDGLEPVAPEEAPEAPAAVAAAENDDADPAEGLSSKDEQIAALRNAITASRGQLRELKTQKDQVAAMQQEIATLKPYAEFLRQNPHLLQPQTPRHEVAPQPAHDAEAEVYAKRFALYRPDGTPDLGTAREILNDQQQRMHATAQTAMAPVAEQIWETRAAANINSILQERDGAGQALLTEKDLEQTVATMVQGMPRPRALQMLADPNIVGVIRDTALGRKYRTQRAAAVPAPEYPPLHRESAGGGERVVLDESEKRVYRQAGISDKTALEFARKFNPNGYNEME